MSSDGVAANGTSAGDAASVDASMGNANGHSDTAIDDSFSETQNGMMPRVVFLSLLLPI